MLLFQKGDPGTPAFSRDRSSLYGRGPCFIVETLYLFQGVVEQLNMRQLKKVNKDLRLHAQSVEAECNREIPSGPKLVKLRVRDSLTPVARQSFEVALGVAELLPEFPFTSREAFSNVALRPVMKTVPARPNRKEIH